MDIFINMFLFLNSMGKKRGLMLVFLTALISGISIFINKFGVSGIDSDIFAFSKNLIVAVFLISIILLFRQFNELKKLNKKDWLNLGLIGLIGGSIPFILFFKGLQMTSSLSASFIHKMMFLFVIALAFVFLKEKLNWKIVAGAISLLIGVFLLIKFNFNQDILSFGNLLILTATVLWAIENTYSKHVLKILSGNAVAFGRMFFGSIFILIYLFLFNKTNLLVNLSSNQLLWIVITSVFLLGYVLTWYNGLKYVKVSTAACILLLGTVVTTLLNYILLKQSIDLSQLIGIVFILTGILFLIELSKIKEQLKWKTTS